MTNNNSPAVSVIIPIYNTPEQYLRECLDSVRAQTFTDFEVICVNNASTELHIDEVIDEYCLNDNRFRKVSVTVNRRVGGGRNAGLEVAQGKYIQFVDADDILVSHALQTTVKRAEITNADVVLFDTIQFTSQKTEGFGLPLIKSVRIHFSEQFSDHLLNKISFNLPAFSWNKLFRFDFLKKNNLRFCEGKRLEDWHFCICCTPYLQNIEFTDEILYKFRCEVETTSSSPFQWTDCSLAFIDAKNEMKQSGTLSGETELLFILVSMFAISGHFFEGNVKIQNFRNFHDLLYSNIGKYVEQIGIERIRDHLKYLKSFPECIDFWTDYLNNREKYPTIPPVSIIIPIYNTKEEFLRECLDSVRNQIFTNFEVICVNNASIEPHVDEVIDEYCLNDNRFRKVNVTINRRIGGGRNAGLEVAQGKYIQFLDSDDILVPHALQTAIERAESTDADVVFFNVSKFDSNTGKIIEESILNRLRSHFGKHFQGNTLEKLSFNHGPFAWNKLFNKSFLSSNLISFCAGLRVEDAHFCIIASSFAKKIEFVDKVLYMWRRGIDSLAVTSPLQWAECSLAYIKAKEYLEDAGIFHDENELIFMISSMHMIALLNFGASRMFHNYDQCHSLFQLLFQKFIESVGLNKIKEYRCFLNEFRPEIKELWSDSFLSQQFQYNPAASIIIPIYNTKEEYLRECLDSVQDQTFSDFEVICVNNGSTEPYITDVLSEYTQNDLRFQVITLSENKMGGGGRNAGFDVAKGEYVLFVDSDDILLPTLLEVAFREAKTNDLDIVVYDFFRNNEAILEKLFDKKGIHNDRDIALAVAGPWNKIIRTDLLRKNAIRFIEEVFIEEILFCWAVIPRAKSIKRIHDALYIYRDHSEALCTTNHGTIMRAIQCVFGFEYIKNDLVRNGWFAEFETEYYFEKFGRFCKYVHMLDQENFKHIESLKKLMNDAISQEEMVLIDDFASIKSWYQTVASLHVKSIPSADETEYFNEIVASSEKQLSVSEENKRLHVFFVHTYLVERVVHKIIEKLGIDPLSCKIITWRSFTLHNGFIPSCDITDINQRSFYNPSNPSVSRDSVKLLEDRVREFTNGVPFIFYVPGTHLTQINIIASMESCIGYRVVEDGLDAYTEYAHTHETHPLDYNYDISKQCNDNRVFYLSRKCINMDHPKYRGVFGLFDGSFPITPNRVLLGNIFTKIDFPDQDGADAILAICNVSTIMGRPVAFYIETLRWLIENVFIPKGYKKVLYKFRKEDATNQLYEECLTLFGTCTQIDFVEIDASLSLEDIVNSDHIPIYADMTSALLYAAKLNKKSYSFVDVYYRLDPKIKDIYDKRLKSYLHFSQTLEQAGVEMLHASDEELLPYRLNILQQRGDEIQHHVLNSHRILSERLNALEKWFLESNTAILAKSDQLAAVLQGQAVRMEQISGQVQQVSSQVSTVYHEQAARCDAIYSRMEQLLQKPPKPPTFKRRIISAIFPYGSFRWKIGKAAQERRLIRTTLSFMYRKTVWILKATLRPFFPRNTFRRKIVDAIREGRFLKTTLYYFLRRVEKKSIEANVTTSPEQLPILTFPTAADRQNDDAA